jgi:long-chain acyl-CoA synthetase
VVLHTLLNVIHRCETVKFVIVYGNENGPPGAIPAKTANGRVTIKTFEEVLILGSAKPVAPVRAHENDVATICYTSGTTGDPKGVVLTHLNLCSNAAGYSYDLNIGIGDIHVSYLPLAHIYERVTFMVCVMGGAAVGFYRGDVLGLLDDVQALKPTIFCSVPRLWNRIYDKVNAGVAEGSPIARMLFAKAYASKKYAFENGKPPNPFWEKLVFSKLKAKLGGRVRYMSSGSAPIGGHVIEFLRICFGAVVLKVTG